MTSDFKAAVKWLDKQLDHVVVDGRLDFPSTTFADIAVSWVTNAKTATGPGGAIRYEISEEVAEVLLSLSREHYQFFDTCIQICALHVSKGYPLPHALRLFAGAALAGKTLRPTPPHRERKRNWLEQKYLHTLCHQTSKDFGLFLTNNDFTAREGACDAVVLALRQKGVKKNSKELRDLLTHKSKERLRSEFEAADRLFSLSSPKILNALNPGFLDEQERYADKVEALILSTIPNG
ncbi:MULTISPECIES: hypothetical protein [unclassified Ruegeria]|uniref:hypothetical protein n=1 Tax=unclassified Ruegeria TaxID=2625375 RepID=UPI00149224A6|nr:MULTISPECIES: hypothetical protein [unclassified Ruegeria]NOD48724.1 hypothetical protein [Ruegeria sp. HKCCD5849]NOD51974.1 hypothetical protein [Ruegeria sp. HKCCD5851]NOD66632.1 hypothetical protein [Ruegeria sp. HKCCD7303]